MKWRMMNRYSKHLPSASLHITNCKINVKIWSGNWLCNNRHHLEQKNNSKLSRAKTIVFNKLFNHWKQNRESLLSDSKICKIGMIEKEKTIRKQTKGSYLRKKQFKSSLERRLVKCSCWLKSLKVKDNKDSKSS